MQPRFSTTSLRMSAGFLIWLLHFSAIYIYAALACARGAGRAQWLGLPLLPVVIGALTLAAVAALTAVLWKSLRGDWYDAARRAGQPFIAWIAAMAGGLSLVAVLWAAMPVLWVTACPS